MGSALLAAVPRLQAWGVGEGSTHCSSILQEERGTMQRAFASTYPIWQSNPDCRT